MKSHSLTALHDTQHLFTTHQGTIQWLQERWRDRMHNKNWQHSTESILFCLVCFDIEFYTYTNLLLHVQIPNFARGNLLPNKIMHTTNTLLLLSIRLLHETTLHICPRHMNTRKMQHDRTTHCAAWSATGRTKSLGGVMTWATNPEWVFIGSKHCIDHQSYFKTSTV
jgi:hypothetical protein